MILGELKYFQEQCIKKVKDKQVVFGPDELEEG